MSNFTLARALFACVGSLLLLAGCNSKDDPESAFPDKLRTQVRLRDGPAREKTRIVHYAEDKVTPLWAEVLMTNDHTRNVYYEKNVMTRSEEFYKPEDGGGLYLKRTYQPDGRNLRTEEQLSPDGSVVMTGERFPDGTYSRNFYGATHQLVRHHLIAINGDTIGDELYWPSGALQQKTTRSGDVLTVDSFDEAGFPILSTSRDSLGYKESKTVYYAGSKQIRIKSERAYYSSTVVMYRADGSVEQHWVRNNQTLVIEHQDKAGNVVWRQNLLLYRFRMGAPAKLSDWRIFSTEDVNLKGAVTRRIIFGKTTHHRWCASRRTERLSRSSKDCSKSCVQTARLRSSNTTTLMTAKSSRNATRRRKTFVSRSTRLTCRCPLKTTRLRQRKWVFSAAEVVANRLPD